MSCQWGGYRASKARPGYRRRSEQAGLAGAVQGPMLRAIVTLKEAKAAASGNGQGFGWQLPNLTPDSAPQRHRSSNVDAETA